MNPNTLKNLNTARYSQYDYTKDVSDNIQERFRDLVEDRFEWASTLENIEEQESIGSSQYNAVKARITHIINPNTGEVFGDEIQKLIFKDYTHSCGLGYMYKYKSSYWLTININDTNNATKHSVIRKCNNKLKWISKTDNKTLLSWDCVFAGRMGNTGLDYGTSGVPQVSGDANILVQLNTYTSQVSVNDRFIFDGHAFQVSSINNHMSDTYLIFTVFETQINPEDDLINNVANGKGIVPDSSGDFILPNTTSLIVGKTLSYSVGYYEGGVVDEDTYTITASGVPLEYYELSVANNGFSLKFFKETSVPLTVSCVNNQKHSSVSIQVTASKGW